MYETAERILVFLIMVLGTAPVIGLWLALVLATTKRFLKWLE